MEAGQIDGSQRGVWAITEAGRSRLAGSALNRTRVAQTARTPQNAVTPTADDDLAPAEVIDTANRRLREALAAELLQTIARCSPAFFEKLVIDVLVKMGYGGTLRDAARSLGRSGDEGVDGVINQDALGLDSVYVQAKRWGKDATVGRPEIQQFAGALAGQRAGKGVFITTAAFSNEAKQYVSKIDAKIVLIDGKKLAHLMMDFGVGVSTTASYEIKRVDSDYFGDDSGA